MKKLITAVVLGSVLMMNTAFANGNKNENVAASVKNTFNQEFANAKDVRWGKTNNYYKAAFTMNNEVMTAYFTTDGDLMGVIHNILSTELPISLQLALKKDYDGYWITELFEMAKDNSNSYFVTLNNADQVITLQSTDGYTWSLYSKEKKQ